MGSILAEKDLAYAFACCANLQMFLFNVMEFQVLQVLQQSPARYWIVHLQESVQEKSGLYKQWVTWGWNVKTRSQCWQGNCAEDEPICPA